jgi:hypothetical protein
VSDATASDLPGQVSRLSCTVSGTGEDGGLRRLVISAVDVPGSPRVVVEAPEGPVYFDAEGRDLILQAVGVVFKSLRPGRGAPRVVAEVSGEQRA